MKKTYITSMPDHIGAFLKASRCFSALGVNVIMQIDVCHKITAFLTVFDTQFADVCGFVAVF